MKYLLILFISVVALASKIPLKEFIHGSKLFTAAVCKEIFTKTEGNLMVSPLSIETALAFVGSGSGGETAQELQSNLYLPSDNEQIESVIKSLLRILKSGEFYTSHIAKKLYVKNELSVKEDFKRTAAQIYEADLENMDFTQRTKARKTMNKWVKKQINNKIDNLVEPNDLRVENKAILLNTLYFKGNWSNPFRPENTLKGDFYQTDQDVIQVDTMHHYDAFYNYYESSKLKAKILELPLEGDEAWMTIILPNEKEGLGHLQKQMAEVLFHPALRRELVNVVLPKFKFETNISFKKILRNLGIHNIFSGNKADLSGIASGLFIDNVMQKTYVNVNEKGVDADVSVTLTALIQRTSDGFVKPKQFIADHPFIFYIKVKNLIVSVGRVSTPNQ